MGTGKIGNFIKSRFIKTRFLLICQFRISKGGPIEIRFIIKEYAFKLSVLPNSNPRENGFILEICLIGKFYRLQERCIIEFCLAMKNSFLKVYICQKFGVIK